MSFDQANDSIVVDASSYQMMIDEIKDLQHQLAVRDLEVMQLRKYLDILCNNGLVTDIFPNTVSEAEQLLSTTFTPDYLREWLGEIVAYRVTHIDGKYELNFNETWQKVKNQKPLYAPKLDMKG